MVSTEMFVLVCNTTQARVAFLYEHDTNLTDSNMLNLTVMFAGTPATAPATARTIYSFHSLLHHHAHRRPRLLPLLPLPPPPSPRAQPLPTPSTRSSAAAGCLGRAAPVQVLPRGAQIERT